MPKLGNVQALRALAVLMVMAVHVGNPFGFEPRYLGGARLLDWVNVPGQGGVDLFFVISGLIITITTWNSDSGVRASGRFLLRRLKRIVPLYWAVSILVLVVFLTRPELVNSHSAFPPEILQSFLMAPQRGLPLVAVGWTLTYEMYFYLVFAAALLAGRSRTPWLLGVWAAVTLGFAAAFQGSSAPTLALLASPLSLEFVLGVAAGYVVMTRPPVAPALLLGCGTLLFVVGLGFGSQIDATALDPWYRVGAVGLPAAMIVVGAVGLERQRRLVASRRAQYVGDASYSIYLWHNLLLVAAGRLLVLALPNPGRLHIVLLILVPVGVVGASLVLYEKLERPLLKAVGKRPAPGARR